MFMNFMLFSIFVVSIIGTASHFLYDFFNHSKLVGVFAAVNESTWEHMKICLTPTIVWSIADFLLYGNNSNYFLAKFISLAVIIFLMPAMFYGYKFLFKKNSVFYNISSFYVVVIVSQLLFFSLVELNVINDLIVILSCIGIFIILFCYFLFTFKPPRIFLFKDPVTNKYGFDGHCEDFNIFKNRGRE